MSPLTTHNPIQYLEESMINMLIGNAGSASLYGKKVYAIQAPVGSHVPFIIIQNVAGGFTNTSPRDDIDVIYQVLAWAGHIDVAYKMANIIAETFQQKELSIPGWSNYRTELGDWVSHGHLAEAVRYYAYGYHVRVRADKIGR